jgi:hypothetical protein
VTVALPRLLPRTFLVGLGSALAGGLLMLGVMGLVGGGTHAGHSSPVFKGAGFSLTVPAGWAVQPGAGSAGAVLRRGDGLGTVIVRRTGPVRGDLRAMARDLTTRLAKAIPGFHLVSARLGRVRAGGAFLYTFAGGGKAQSLVLTRVGGVTYRIDSVVPAGAPDAARQAAAAVASFGG